MKAKIAGLKFGRLTAVRPTEHRVARAIVWECLCDCGSKKLTARNNLMAGGVRSCGCLVADSNDLNHKTHGMGSSATYHTWEAMKQRCLNPNTRSYPRYGGRGITICERWMEFKNFHADMGECPAGLTLDRADNNGNYEPGNCRWATKSEQSNNTSSNHFILVNGMRLTVTQASKFIGIDRKYLHNKLASYQRSAVA